MVGRHLLRIGLFLIVSCVVASSPYAQGQDRDAEIDEIRAIVTRAVKEGLQKKLDAEIAPEEAVPPGERTPIRRRWGLIVDKGSLRRINDTDRSLAPNHYLTIVYEKDYQQRSWRIVALDNQNMRREAFSIGGRW